MTNII